MAELFYTLIYYPIYNLLIFLISALPGNSVALAIVVLTIIIKLALLPLAVKAVRTQQKMKEIAPKIEEIKEKYKDNKQEQALKLMELYRQEDIKPFRSFLLILLQLPVIFGLYFVFYKSSLPSIDFEHLYSFISAPQFINMQLFGIDIKSKSIILAFLASLAQFAHAKLTAKDIKFTTEKDEQDSFKAELEKSIQTQMLYVLPAIIGFAAYSLGAGIALYFIVSSLFAVAQEYWMKYKKIK